MVDVSPQSSGGMPDLINAMKAQALNTGGLVKSFTSLASSITAILNNQATTISTQAGQIASLQSAVSGLQGAVINFIPQGRLTLTSATPVLTSTVSGATTVYYSPYTGFLCPLWNGSAFNMVSIGGELSQATTDATKSPAAVGASSLYDMFVWKDGNTYRCTRGPAWSSGTTRGTGAGTTELNRVSGVLVNKVAITNGPAAGYGTYVGTIASNGSSTIDFIFGAAATNGTAGALNVWNAYNRTKISTFVQDSTSSWTYGSGTIRAAHGSNTNRVTFISGLQEDCFMARYRIDGAAGASGSFTIGVGFDSTSAYSSPQGGSATTTTNQISCEYTASALGQHYVQALENNATSTATFFGNSSALTFDFMM